MDRWDREGWARVAGMTLGEAIELRRGPSIVCACIGPPLCCRFAYQQAEALHRAAHIAANLMLRARAQSPRMRTTT